MAAGYFNTFMTMMISPSITEEKDAAADSTQLSSIPTPVTISLPFTPIDAVEFSTPHEPQYQWS